MNKHSHLLAILWLATGGAGCAENSPSLDVLVLAVNQPKAAGVAAAATPAIIDLEWAQLAFDLPDRSKFQRSQIPAAILALEGKRVRFRGYMLPHFQSRGIKQFALVGEIPEALIFSKKRSADPYSIPLHHLMIVQMAAGKSTAYTTKPIAVVGRFSIQATEREGTLVCIFQLEADSVEEVKPRDGYWPAVSNGC